MFPLPDGTYTSNDSFGWRIDPVTGDRRFHTGSDLAAPAGTPILAIADGRVAFAGERGTYGGLIVLELARPVRRTYTHGGGGPLERPAEFTP